MKKILFLNLLAVAFSANASAYYGQDLSISCKGGDKKSGRLEVTARSIIQYEGRRGARLLDATFTYTSDGQAEIGKRAVIDSDENYEPTQPKYEYLARFDLSKAVDTVTFGDFTPGRFCEISFLVPGRPWSLNVEDDEEFEFKAYFEADCHRSKREVSMKCVSKWE